MICKNQIVELFVVILKYTVYIVNLSIRGCILNTTAAVEVQYLTHSGATRNVYLQVALADSTAENEQL